MVVGWPNIEKCPLHCLWNLSGKIGTVYPRVFDIKVATYPFIQTLTIFIKQLLFP